MLLQRLPQRPHEVAERAPQDNRVQWTPVTPSPRGVARACIPLGCHLRGGQKSTHVFRCLNPGALKCLSRVTVDGPPPNPPQTVKTRISVF